MRVAMSCLSLTISSGGSFDTSSANEAAKPATLPPKKDVTSRTLRAASSLSVIVKVGIFLVCTLNTQLQLKTKSWRKSLVISA